MFQSAGLFKDVSCPYFLYGLCERPHCHFKHSKHEEAKARKAVEEVKKESDEPYVLPQSSLQRTLLAIEANIKNEKLKIQTKDGQKEENNKKKEGNSLKNKPTGTPEYNPTPIPELKQKQTKATLGRSKYDLALLEKPDNDTEYDPECNYSGVFQSGSKGDDPLPDYAKTLHSSTSVKRPASDGEEDGESLAKIPKFVSVEYTPAGADGVESEEDPISEEHGDWFSENDSEKSSDSSSVLHSDDTNSNVVKNKFLDPPKEDKSPPIEFTSDGCVKFTPTTKEEVKSGAEKVKNSTKLVKENKSSSSDITENANKNKKSSHEENKSASQDVANTNSDKKETEREGNIFSLFKEEFDKMMDDCDKEVSKTESINNHVSDKKVSDKGRRKSSDSDSKVSDKGHRKSSDSDSKTADKKSRESKSHSDHKSHAHNNHKHESRDGHSSHKSSDHRRSSSEKLSTTKHSSSSKHTSSPSKHSSLSPKHSSLSSKHSSSHSKHYSSSSRDDKHHSSSKHDKHDNHHDEKHKHHDSKHERHRDSKLDSHRDSKHDKHHDSKHEKHRDSKHERHHDSKRDNHHEEKHKHRESKHDKHRDSKHGKHESSKHSDSKKHGDSPKKSSKHDKESSGHKKKSKTIVNLDVDLFGEDVINLSNSRQDFDDDDDLADLAKYFEDEDPFEECLRIFNEDQGKNNAAKAPEKKKLKSSTSTESAPSTSVGKKRIAMKETDEKVKRQKIEDKPKPKPSPAQVMMNRYKMMQERALQEEQERKEKIKAKVREMQADKMAKPAPQVAGPSLSGSMASFSSYMKDKTKKTTAITVAKGAKRKAHTPTVPVEKLKRPVVEVTSSSKVPANVRQRYLNAFIDECLKLCSSEKEAYDKGKEEEEAVFSRCSNKKIYLNIAVNTIKRLRQEIEDKKAKVNGKSPKKTTKLSHASVLDGAHAAKASYTVNRSGGAVKLREEDFSGADLYKRLKTYILSEEQLNTNNFPRPDPNKGGCAVFLGEQDTSQKGSVKGYEKICLRCGRRFEVYPNGKYPKKEDCIYHWGKAWKKRVAGTVETRYTCCSGDLSADGCQVAKAHVHETNKRENFSGYMKTIPCSPPIDGDYGVYAMDCEMVYTTMGMELARVTVVGGDCEIAYESLVLPDNPVVDCNTRFSGITDEDLEDVHTSLRDVQAVLLSLFTDKTILIGHSLESDLTALKLIHNTVVDTSIVFPHRMGLPYKRALKNLMAEYLKKIIQDDVAGHDSHEDALACIQLMQFKLKEDARKEARRLSS